MEMFDPVQDEWVKQPEPDFMSTSPHVGSLACMEDYLYVIGGSDSSGTVIGGSDIYQASSSYLLIRFVTVLFTN